MVEEWFKRCPENRGTPKWIFMFCFDGTSMNIRWDRWFHNLNMDWQWMFIGVHNGLQWTILWESIEYDNRYGWLEVFPPSYGNLHLEENIADWGRFDSRTWYIPFWLKIDDGMETNGVYRLAPNCHTYWSFLMSYIICVERFVHEIIGLLGAT